MSIEDWRTEIDAIDSELLGLLNQRASLAVKVGQSKRLTGVALYDPRREEEVIERARSANPGPLDEQAIEDLTELRTLGPDRSFPAEFVVPRRFVIVAEKQARCAGKR